MDFWEIFWAAVIIFSVLSFTYMSAKMLILGVPELKEMFSALNEEHQRRNNSKV